MWCRSWSQVMRSSTVVAIQSAEGRQAGDQTTCERGPECVGVAKTVELRINWLQCRHHIAPLGPCGGSVPTSTPAYAHERKESIATSRTEFSPPRKHHLVLGR